MTVYLQYYYKLKKRNIYCKKNITDNNNYNDNKTKSLSLSFNMSKLTPTEKNPFKINNIRI